MSISVSEEEIGPVEEHVGVAPDERPVPRISIHVFCVHPDLAATAKRA